MVKYLLIIALFILSLNSYSQQIKVEAFTDTTDYLIGDYINYSLRVEYNDDIKIVLPLFKDSLHSFEIISEDEIKYSKENGRNIAEKYFTLIRFDSADVTIPAIPVFYLQGADTINAPPIDLLDTARRDSLYSTALSNPVNITVHSLQVAAEEEIRDVKEPLTYPLDWRIILLYALIALIIFALGLYLYKKYKKSKSAAPSKKVIPIPADILALTELDNLERKELWQKGEVKQYHSEITEIIRRYFELRFNLPALELTTGEALHLIKNNRQTEPVAGITEQFLTNADLVKFAKFQPMDSVNLEMMQQAKQIVEQTGLVNNREENVNV